MDRFLTIRDVCAQVGASKATVYRWIQAGEFPHGDRPFADLSVGAAAVRWPASAIEAWIEARKEAKTA